MSKECPEGKIINPASGRYVKADGAIGKSLLSKEKASDTKTLTSKEKTSTKAKKIGSEASRDSGAGVSKPFEGLGTKASKSRRTSGTNIPKSPTREETVAILSSTATDYEIVSKLRTLYGIKMKSPTKFTDLPPDVYKLIFEETSPISSKSLFLVTKGINKALQDGPIWKIKIRDEFGIVRIKNGESPLLAYNKLSRYRAFILKALAINRKEKLHAVYFITKESFLGKLFQLKPKILLANDYSNGSYQIYALRSDGKDKAYIGDTKSEKDKDVVSKLAVMMYNGKLVMAEEQYDYIPHEGIPSGTIDKLSKAQKRK